MSLDPREIVFFDFMKSHPTLGHLKYKEDETVGLQLIGVPTIDGYTDFMKTFIDDEKSSVLDPNWDELYSEFLKQCDDDSAKEYISSIVDSASREQLVELVISFILYISSNIDSDNLYVAIGDGWRQDWLTQLAEV